ncbi:cytochrome c oxidase assembly protein [Parasphingorhabdus sp. DH2-15]|uniref:cytochrome c oxidase assembly protein n=1 Tax=Parasphingorhabdus sp. DH2-15 TaxID=3444112 RepID=UPI003F687BE5
MSAAISPEIQRRNNRSAFMGFALVAGMVALGFAAVPLYNLFCRVTGFGGTPQIVDQAKASTVAIGTQTITVRFDANTDSALPWEFAPEQVSDHMTIGTRDMAIYTAENLTNQPITGRAGYNVTPVQAGKYFNKIQCFCFTEQTLQPGEKVRMPVLYYVDPAILEDEDTKNIEEITLSYTFYRVDPDNVGG